METISISELKAHLSGEIKKVRQGTKLTILDHNHPVAELVPLQDEKELFIRGTDKKYKYKTLPPLIAAEKDIQRDIKEERSDRW
ncbi:MAG: hypothetical protein B6241_04940 [Spirochaetaceae bacterium 4572_59]|nr:MAG: hypothetical protein B6241_04940 [Spirochaetaceae bacterium 4572_59]